MPRLAARIIVLFLFVAVCPAAAPAQISRVQPPGRKASSPERVAKVKKARAQGVPPRQAAGIARTLDRRAKALGEQGLTSRRFRSTVSTAPLGARLEVFVKAAARRGVSIQTFERRLRGMQTLGKKKVVVTAKKTFFEVTPESFDLFPKIMGENVIWFAAAPNPGHLHTLLADQNGGPTFTHNTYGEATLTAAKIDSKQYMAPALLTGAEMDRFVRYLNAGVAHGRNPVYGFRTSSGEFICQTACTNWATSAPVGDLHRWIRTVDRRVSKAAAEGRLPAKYRGGLHALLAATPTAEARAAIVAEVIGADGITPHTKASAKRLRKEFDIVAEKWPQRPLDLVGRESLADLMGVPRSRDPAKWVYDLFLSKRVPVIGVLSSTRQDNFADTLFDLEVMGNIGPSGDVVPGEGSHGVVPPERRPGYVPPPPAAEAPAAETPAAAAEPAAAPTEP